MNLKNCVLLINVIGGSMHQDLIKIHTLGTTLRAMKLDILT